LNDSQTPRTAENKYALSSAEEYRYVASVDTHIFGFIDGHTPSDPEFSLSTLQSADESYAVLEEQQADFTAKWEYYFNIPTDPRFEFQDFEIQASGYCGDNNEQLDFYWRTSPTYSFSLFGSILYEDTSPVLISCSPDVVGTLLSDFIQVRVVDTFGAPFEFVSQWHIDYIRVRWSDPYTQALSVELNQVFDDDNLYPGRGAGTEDFYRFTCTTSDDDGGSTINEVELRCKEQGIGGVTQWSVKWTSANDWAVDDPGGIGVRASLVTTECSTEVSGNTRTVCFAVRVLFGHPDLTDVDWRLRASSHTLSDVVTWDTICCDGAYRDIDIHTSVEWEETPALAQTRCNQDGAAELFGSATFVDSPSGVGVGAGASVHVVRSTPSYPTWSIDQSLSVPDNGAFSVMCQTIGPAGSGNTFEIELRTADADLLLGPVSDSLVIDSVVAFGFGAVDDDIIVGTAATVYTELKYLSDGMTITAGSLIWSGVVMNYNLDSGRWEGNTSVESSPTKIRYDLITVTTPEGVSAVYTHPFVDVTWYKESTTIHVDFATSTVYTSTRYDPQGFLFDIWLTDGNGTLIPGWIDLSIGTENASLYCDGIAHQYFSYFANVSGGYSLQVRFAGDALHDPATLVVQGLTVLARDLTIDASLPSSMQPELQAPFSLTNVLDADFQGVFEGVTYIGNFPVNLTFSIWWTLSPTYSELLVYVDSWDIVRGQGAGSLVLPWDLNGDGRLTEIDFTCYVVITIDGHGIYENVTINLPMPIMQSVLLDMQVPSLTYSDATVFQVRATPLCDPTFMHNLDFQVSFYVSSDNSSWVLIDTVLVNTTGCANCTWVCMGTDRLYVKAVTGFSSHYAQSVTYASGMVMREGTVLSIEHADTFTFSDQGVIVGRLTTDDDTPLSDYLVFLEIKDGDWVSIGSGMTNESGHASILWIPSLPAGTYSIQLRAPLVESQFYGTPTNVETQLAVGKEMLLLSVDTSDVWEGHIRAMVKDDEGNPVEKVGVDLLIGREIYPLQSLVTDSDGVCEFSVTLQDGDLVRVVVAETSYYLGVADEVNVVMPPDLMLLIVASGVGFVAAIGIALARKTRRALRAAASIPPGSDVKRALEEERHRIPERVREESERKLEVLDGSATTGTDKSGEE